MTIKINVLSSLDELDIWLKDIGRNAVLQATKSSMLRTRPTMKKESVSMIKNFKKAKTRAITDRLSFERKLSGKNVNNFEVNMVIARKPIRLINFIKGNKNIQKRKGIPFPFRRRRKLKVEVQPGRVRKLPTSFIDRGSGGTKMVLLRRTDNPRPIRRSAGVYFHHLFAQKTFTKPIEKAVGKRVQKEFVAAIENKMRKLKPKGNLKKE